MRKELRSALFDTLASQIVLGLLAGLMLDGGMCFQFWAFSMAASIRSNPDPHIQQSQVIVFQGKARP